EEGPATPYPADPFADLQILAGGYSFGIGRIGIRSPDAARPFPDIAAHILDTIGTRATRKTPDGAGGDEPCAAVVGAIVVGLIAPGVGPAVHAARRLLPLRLVRQRDTPPLLAQQRG